MTEQTKDPKTGRLYPRDAWVLQPSFKPKQVRIVKAYWASGSTDYGDITDAGKLYAPPHMHDTQLLAIEWGAKDLDRQQEKLDKMQAALAKKREELRKAFGKAS